MSGGPSRPWRRRVCSFSCTYCKTHTRSCDLARLTPSLLNKGQFFSNQSHQGPGSIQSPRLKLLFIWIWHQMKNFLYGSSSFWNTSCSEFGGRRLWGSPVSEKEKESSWLCERETFSGFLRQDRLPAPSRFCPRTSFGGTVPLQALQGRGSYPASCSSQLSRGPHTGEGGWLTAGRGTRHPQFDSQLCRSSQTPGQRAAHPRLLGLLQVLRPPGSRALRQ